jgi:hypothetical protein
MRMVTAGLLRVMVGGKGGGGDKPDEKENVGRAR